MRPLLVADLDHVVAQVGPFWQQLRGKNILVTGGTGFFGQWLLDSWQHANRLLDLRSRLWVVSRGADRFVADRPHYADTAGLVFHAADVRHLSLPASVSLDYIVHAATPAALARTAEDPLLLRSAIVDGTQQVLEVARRHGKPKVLLVSSGAVYGAQPAPITHLPEDCALGPNMIAPDSVYGESKRQAEQLCMLYAQCYGLRFVVARCFSFIGPLLPLEGTYAIGNFIRDGRQGGPIVVRGNGTAQRSYLYMADLTYWLWRLLLQGEDGTAYNVGSGQAQPMAAIAEQVAHFYGCSVTIAGTDRTAPERAYVPGVQRARATLGLAQHVDLAGALARTETYLRQAEPCT